MEGFRVCGLDTAIFQMNERRKIRGIIACTGGLSGYLGMMDFCELGRVS